jgi:pimeloyl-ACP methyl ester carboxylesterase
MDPHRNALSSTLLLLLLPQGWGMSSLDEDASELRLLAQCLAEQHDSSGWVLMGHSTGCQDAVR